MTSESLLSCRLRQELARRSFWEFCNYLEPEFYKPEREHLQILCATLEKFYYNQLLNDQGRPFHKLMIRMPPQHGKAIWDETPVLTSKGWKNHGDLAVGDSIFGVDGLLKQVTATQESYDHECVSILLDTGESIECSKNHEWVIEFNDGKRNNDGNRKGRVTKIVESQDIFNRYNAKSPAIKLSHPLMGDEIILPIDPYLLGIWLGDGDSKTGWITEGKQDLEHFKNYCERFEKRDDCYRFKILGLNQTSLKANKLFKNKHIPEIYFNASEVQRFELFLGLMDSDGYASRDGCCCKYVSIRKELAEGFSILCRSLGIKTTVKESDAKLYGRIVSKKYRVTFTPNKEQLIFKLPRKQDLIDRKLKKDRNDKNLYFVKSVTGIGMRSVKCITVEGGIYLVGKGLIPTHNSRSLVNFTKWTLGKNNEERIITASHSDGQASDFSRYTRDGISEVKNIESQVVYSDVFPDTKIKQGNASFQKWALEGQHFNYLGVGVGGGVTGKGATIRIMDDLIKDAEVALSDNALSKIWVWLSGTFSSRNAAIGGDVKEIFCATIWGEQDPQMILETTEPGEWYILAMPIYNQETDQMLCPDMMSKESYLKLKHRMEVDSRTKMIFQANYHCIAISDDETKVFPINSLKTYKELPQDEVDPKDPTKTVQNYFTIGAIDSADEGTDNFAMPIARVYGDRVYLVDAIFDQNNLTIQEGQVQSKVKEHKISHLLIETNSFGAYFSRRVRELMPQVEVFGQFAKANKMSRILANAGLIKLYFYFPENPTVELQKGINETTKLMKTSTKQDDFPDALAALAAYLEKYYGLFKSE